MPQRIGSLSGGGASSRIITFAGRVPSQPLTRTLPTGPSSIAWPLGRISDVPATRTNGDSRGASHGRIASSAASRSAITSIAQPSK